MKNTRSSVLVLNSGWIPIGIRSVKEAITAIYDSNDWYILQIDYINGERLVQPVEWRQWVELDVPDYCNYIQTRHKKIRVPTVIISKRYNKLHMYKPKLTLENVYERDRGVCQYTGKKLSNKNRSIDHVIPLSKGGKNSWDNIVLCDKLVNSRKGNKMMGEHSYKLRTTPIEPTPKPPINRIRDVHRDWELFLAS